MAFHHHPANGSRYPWSILTWGQYTQTFMPFLLLFVQYVLAIRLDRFFVESIGHTCANVILIWKVLSLTMRFKLNTFICLLKLQQPILHKVLPAFWLSNGHSEKTYKNTSPCQTIFWHHKRAANFNNTIRSFLHHFSREKTWLSMPAVYQHLISLFSVLLASELISW